MSKIIYCLNCSKELFRGQFKFCSSSCSAKISNGKRVRYLESRKKTSDSLRRKLNLEPLLLDDFIKLRTPKVRKSKVQKYLDPKRVILEHGVNGVKLVIVGYVQNKLMVKTIVIRNVWVLPILRTLQLG